MRCWKVDLRIGSSSWIRVREKTVERRKGAKFVILQTRWWGLATCTKHDLFNHIQLCARLIYLLHTFGICLNFYLEAKDENLENRRSLRGLSRMGQQVKILRSGQKLQVI